MPNIALVKYWMDKAEALEEQLKEKDAMIDWLADKLEKSGFKDRYAIHWRKLAQEAVKKDD